MLFLLMIACGPKVWHSEVHYGDGSVASMTVEQDRRRTKPVIDVYDIGEDGCYTTFEISFVQQAEHPILAINEITLLQLPVVDAKRNFVGRERENWWLQGPIATHDRPNGTVCMQGGAWWAFGGVDLQVVFDDSTPNRKVYRQTELHLPGPWDIPTYHNGGTATYHIDHMLVWTTENDRMVAQVWVVDITVTATVPRNSVLDR